MPTPSERTYSKKISGLSPRNLLIIVIGTIAMLEILAMALFHFFPDLPFSYDLILDAVFLTLFLLPALYFFVYRPLEARTRQAELAEQKLHELSRQLEAVVNTRTVELTREIEISHEQEKNLRQKEAELERSVQTLGILNKLLLLSLEDLPINQSLERFLNLLTSFPWFELKPKGAVFLKDPESNTLIMICQRDLAPDLLIQCARVPYGKCLCGQAAESGTIVYAHELDHRHHIRYEGIQEHGHYCVPIYSQTHEMLGVFTLYLNHDQARNTGIEETLLATAGVVGSIIEHKRSTELLRLERDRNQQYLDIMGTLMVALDTNGMITLINQSGTSILEYEEDELLGRNWFDTCLPAETKNEIKEVFNNILKSSIKTFETFENQVLTKSGRTKIMLFRNTLIHDDSGKVTGILSSGTDITERKESEQEREALQTQLRQAQKMEAIGTLAGGIAHDFNNILTAILGYSEMAKDCTPPDSPASDDLDQVIQAGKRARDLVKHILAFSRQVEQNRIPLRLAPILKEAIKLLRASIPANIEIRQSIYSETSPVLADPVQIHQVLMNLCTNASHAMEKNGGILSIRLEDVTLMSDDLQSLPDLTPGTYARLQVSDTGHGISEQAIKRIFDPYFTTKPQGKGTGLGLSVVHGIIKSYKGAITVTSELNKGTIFNVYLPQVEDSASTNDETLETVAGGDETIMVVDDEPSITKVIDNFLTMLGYQVICRDNSTQAFDTFLADPGNFDLIITDQSMPGMTGGELAKAILQVRPDMPIILCTGYSETLGEEDAKKIGIREYVTKPVIRDDLVRIVRKVLDNAKPGFKTEPDSAP